CIARRKIAEEVEPALAGGDDARLREQRLERRQRGIVELGRVMRMNAGRRVQAARAQVGERRGRAARGDRRAGDDQTVDAARCGAVDHGLAVAVEAVVGQIDADVYETHGAGIVTAGGAGRKSLRYTAERYAWLLQHSAHSVG